MKYKYICSGCGQVFYTKPASETFHTYYYDAWCEKCDKHKINIFKLNVLKRKEG